MTTPAHDPRLPRLWDALDEHLMLDLFEGHLPILRCRPTYVRYKPATSCLVLYDVALKLSTGAVIDTVAHVTMYAEDRGRIRASNKRMHRLLERASAVMPQMAGRQVAY